MKDTVRALTMMIGIDFMFVSIAWVGMWGILSITWLGGII